MKKAILEKKDIRSWMGMPSVVANIVTHKPPDPAQTPWLSKLKFPEFKAVKVELKPGKVEIDIKAKDCVDIPVPDGGQDHYLYIYVYVSVLVCPLCFKISAWVEPHKFLNVLTEARAHSRESNAYEPKPGDPFRNSQI